MDGGLESRTVHTTNTAALKSTTHPKTRCRKPYVATQHLMLLMMGVYVPETCQSKNTSITLPSCIKLAFILFLNILVRIFEESIAFDILPSPQNGVVLQVAQAVDLHAVTMVTVTQQNTLGNKGSGICSMGLLLVEVFRRNCSCN